MAPVRFNASEQEFRDASYMVETVYRQDGPNVFMLMTSGRSNAGGGYPALWDVFILGNTVCMDVLPYRYPFRTGVLQKDTISILFSLQNSVYERNTKMVLLF